MPDQVSDHHTRPQRKFKLELSEIFVTHRLIDLIDLGSGKLLKTHTTRTGTQAMPSSGTVSDQQVVETSTGQTPRF